MTERPVRFPDPFVSAAFTQYGATMLAVQIWEMELVALVGAASLSTSGGKPALLERELRDAFRRTWKLMHKPKASSLRKLLRSLADGKIVDESLVEEISALNEWRRFLAQDYLRSQLSAGGELRCDPSLISELLELGDLFSASGQRMQDATRALLARDPKSQSPKKVREVVERISQELPSTRPAPLSMPVPDPAMIPVASSIKLWERSGRRPG